MYLKSIFFIVETEHENNSKECTTYHRETVKKKLYTSRESAEQACVDFSAALPMGERGHPLGSFGEIYFDVHEVTIPDSMIRPGENHYEYDDD